MTRTHQKLMTDLLRPLGLTVRRAGQAAPETPLPLVTWEADVPLPGGETAVTVRCWVPAGRDAARTELMEAVAALVPEDGLAVEIPGRGYALLRRDDPFQRLADDALRPDRSGGETRWRLMPLFV